jgi:hypothetical protein
MFISKVKVVASLVVAAALAGTGAVVVTQYAIAADKAAKAKAQNDAAGKFKGDKGDYVQPDVSGTVTDVAQGGKQLTIQIGKGGKTEPATTATVQLTAATDVTFSAIGIDGDKVAPGFNAQVWFEPNSNTKASRIAYTGQLSQKDTRPADVVGKIVSVSADGKKVSIESRPQAQKGFKGDKADAPAKGEKGDKPAKGEKGEKGVKGEVADPGEKAAKGEKVAKGDLAEKGVKGDPAQKVAKGEKPNAGGEKFVKGEQADKGGPVIEVAVTPQTQMTFSAVTTGGATLKEGYDVSAIYDPKAPGAAAMVRVTGPEGAAMKSVDRGNIDLAGRVAAVAPDGKSVSIEFRPEVKKGEDKNAGGGGPKVKVEEPLQRVDVPITAATKVIYTNVPAGGATPTVDYHANVWLDGTAAKTIHFDAASREKKGPDLNTQVIAVSADGKRLTVALPPKEKFGNPEERDIDIANAKIIFNNVHPGEAKPQEGYQAQIYLDPTSPTVAKTVILSPGKNNK